MTNNYKKKAVDRFFVSHPDHWWTCLTCQKLLADQDMTGISRSPADFTWAHLKESLQWLKHLGNAQWGGITQNMLYVSGDPHHCTCEWKFCPNLPHLNSLDITLWKCLLSNKLFQLHLISEIFNSSVATSLYHFWQHFFPGLNQSVILVPLEKLAIIIGLGCKTS